MATKKVSAPNAVSRNRKSLSKNKTTDAAIKIKPSGLCGLYKGKIILNGTSNEVFNLGL